MSPRRALAIFALAYLAASVVLRAIERMGGLTP